MTSTTKTKRAAKARSQTAGVTALGNNLGSVLQMRLCELKPSPENDSLYKPVDPNDPAIIAMAKSMREPHGVLELFPDVVDWWIEVGGVLCFWFVRFGFQELFRTNFTNRR